MWHADQDKLTDVSWILRDMENVKIYFTAAKRNMFAATITIHSFLEFSLSGLIANLHSQLR